MARLIILFSFVLSTWALAPVPLSAGEIQVVVHEDNPVSSMSKRDLSRLFLKRTTRWSNGSKVEPLNLAEGNPEREIFLSTAHGMDESSHTKYWVKLIFAGRAQPPPDISTPEQLLHLVRNSLKAVGYVAQGTSLPKGVKTVEIME